MRLTNEIIKSSFFCSFKTGFLIKGVVGNKTDYEKMEMEIKAELISKYVLFRKQTNNKITSNLKLSCEKPFDFDMSTNVSLTSEYADISFDAIEVEDDSLIPIYFSPNLLIAKYEKEYISCLASVLCTELAVDIKICKIVYEKNNKFFTQKVRMSVYQARAKEKIKKIERLTNPVFCLNKYCILCEYNSQCIDMGVRQISFFNRDMLIRFTL